MQPDDFPWETLLGKALLSQNPVQTVQGEEALSSVDEDGLRMAALLVVKLRFERLLAASTTATRLFEEDAGAFATMFRRYHQEVTPVSPMPGDERDLFECWVATQDQ